MVAEEAREIALRGKAEIASDRSQRLLRPLQLPHRFLHAQRVPVDVGRQIDLLLEQREEMRPRQADAARHVVEADALADIGLHQLDRLADAEVLHGVNAGAPILRRRCVGGIEHAVDEAFDLVIGDVVDTFIVAEMVKQIGRCLVEPWLQRDRRCREQRCGSRQVAAPACPVRIDVEGEKQPVPAIA